MGIYNHKQHMESRQYKEATQNQSGEFKAKGWSTPYGFADYQEPVTYEQACADMKALQEQFFNPRQPEAGNKEKEK